MTINDQHGGDVSIDEILRISTVTEELGDEERAVMQMLRPGDLAGMITFVGGAPSQVSATLYAVGDTQVLGMAKDKFEALLDNHPRIVYRVIRGLARSMHGIVLQGNAQTS